jgi:hypothetical protein
MSRSELASLWRTRLSDFALSDCSREEWCMRQGVTMHQLRYWRKRFASDSVPEPTQGPSALEAMPDQELWLAVTFTDAPPVSSPCLTLRISGGEIDLLPGFDPALLRSIVQALGGERC